MQLNRFTDYALRVLIYAAVRGEGKCTARDAAAAFGVSRHHVVKVVHTLHKLGYLDTVRGRGGGFTLAQAPDEIGLGEVVRRTERTLALVDCFEAGNPRCPLSAACGLQGVLRESVDAFLAVLDRYTLAHLVGRPEWAARVAMLAPGERRAGA